MKKYLKALLSVLAGASMLCHSVVQADLAEIKVKKTLVCGVIDIFEPFGYIDPTTRAMVGYDVDIAAMVQGKVVGVSQSEEPLRKLLNKIGDQASQYTLMMIPNGEGTWGIGVRKNNPKMFAAVNNALTRMEQSGELQAIFDKWLGASTIYKMKRSFKVEPIKS
ncbi:MAG: transporter substrate-binding domain-containing protein [Herbaspirillum sp.]